MGDRSSKTRIASLSQTVGFLCRGKADPKPDLLREQRHCQGNRPDGDDCHTHHHGRCRSIDIISTSDKATSFSIEAIAFVAGFSTHVRSLARSSVYCTS